MSELTIARLREQVTRAADDYWFVQFVEEIERTQITFTFRLYTIRKGMFVQVFWGTRSDTLSLVLIESDQRIFGVDFHRGRWHMHPFGAPNDHVFYQQEWVIIRLNVLWRWSKPFLLRMTCCERTP